jgi:hypothetical protein
MMMCLSEVPLPLLLLPEPPQQISQQHEPMPPRRRRSASKPTSHAMVLGSGQDAETKLVHKGLLAGNLSDKEVHSRPCW